MKEFQTLVVMPAPPAVLFRNMRDHLGRFGTRLANIQSITELSRTIEGVNEVHIANEWRVSFDVPPALRGFLGDGHLGWIDRNRWIESRYTCEWAIEPLFLSGHIACVGSTLFEEALGGKGSRVTLRGTLEIKSSALGSTHNLPGPVTAIAESVVATVLPRNLRSVVEAAAAARP
jgi:hypothetical protein